jgi:porphobilinogen synthase
LVLPLFVRSGRGVREPIPSLPGHFRLSPDIAAEEARQAVRLGLGGVILFGIPDEKDAVGSDAMSDSGIVQQSVRAIKDAAPELLTITDVCCCEYTDHGHCGVLVQRRGRTDVDNDATVELLGRQAVSHAAAGADMVAPSGMMDGMVRAMRGALDAGGRSDVPILSYAVKYASAMYGPFRDAAQSAPSQGDRRGYQMDSASTVGQAIREATLDVAEGADMIMVKPALAYLDVIRQVRDALPGVPTAAYSVSGEYSMVQAAAERGWLDAREVALEALTAIHRAGADVILTYWAKDVARWLA